MALALGGSKKKQKLDKYSVIEIDIFKPGKRYPEIDYGKCRKQQLAEGESSGEDERFHDREAMELVKRLEEKYGKKKTKKGRKPRFGTEDDFIDKSAGYDIEDAFIDDSEAVCTIIAKTQKEAEKDVGDIFDYVKKWWKYDELIPSTMDTALGGFYVNKGKLEFKSKFDELDDSDLSEESMAPESPKKRGRKRTISSGSEAGEEPVGTATTAEPNDVPSKTNGTTATEGRRVGRPPASSVPQRMSGAPPTKKIPNGMDSQSPSQRAALAVKKKLLPKKKSVIAPISVIRKESIAVPAVSSKPIDPPPTSSRSNSAESDIIDVTPTKIPPTTNVSSPVAPPAAGVAPTNNVPQSPAKRKLPPLTDTLNNMLSQLLDDIKKFAGPVGTKRRLQLQHIDKVIKIEDQCTRDGFNSHERARVVQKISDAANVLRTSVNIRCQKRREELRRVKQEAAKSPQKNSSPSATNGNESTATPTTKTISTQVVMPTSWTNQQKTVGKQVIDQLSNSSLTQTAKTDALTRLVNAAQSQVSYEEYCLLINKILPTLNVKSSAPVTTVKKTTESGNSSGGSSTQPGPTMPKLIPGSPVVQTAQATQSVAQSPKSVPANSVTQVPAPKAKQPSAQTSSVATTAPKIANVSATSSVSVKKSDLAAGKAVDIMEGIPSTIAAPTEAELNNISNGIKLQVKTQLALHRKKVEMLRLAGKSPPVFVFKWSTSLHDSIGGLVDRLWQNLRRGGTSEQMIQQQVHQLLQFLIKSSFDGVMKLGEMAVELVRRCPRRVTLLIDRVISAAVAEEKINLNTVFALLPTPPMKHSPPIGKSSGPEKTQPKQQQKLTELDNDIEILPSSSSCAATNGQGPSTSVGHTGSASMPSTSTAAAAPQTVSGISGPLGEIGTLSQEELTQYTQMMTLMKSMGSTQDQLTQAQTIFLVNVVQQRKQAEENAKKRQREDEKAKRAAEKRIEIESAKQRAKEEKQKQKEEEKRKKEEEKTKKLEEDRQRRLKEQQERERQMEEERLRKLKEEQERLMLEEETKRQAEMVKIKQREETERREAERMAQALREEEARAALDLEDETTWDPDDAPKEPTQEELVEEARMRAQEERGAAARAAFAAVQATKPPTESQSQSEAKPLVRETVQLPQVDKSPMSQMIRSPPQQPLTPGSVSGSGHFAYPTASPHMGSVSSLGTPPTHHAQSPYVQHQVSHQSPYAQVQSSPLAHQPQSHQSQMESSPLSHHSGSVPGTSYQQRQPTSCPSEVGGSQLQHVLPSNSSPQGYPNSVIQQQQQQQQQQYMQQQAQLQNQQMAMMNQQASQMNPAVMNAQSQFQMNGFGSPPATPVYSQQSPMHSTYQTAQQQSAFQQNQVQQQQLQQQQQQQRMLMEQQMIAQQQQQQRMQQEQLVQQQLMQQHYANQQYRRF